MSWLQIRKDSPFEQRLKLPARIKQVPDKVKDRFKQEARNLRRVQVAAIKQAFEFYRKIEDAVQRENEHVQQPVRNVVVGALQCGFCQARLTVPERAVLGESLTVEFATSQVANSC